MLAWLLVAQCAEPIVDRGPDLGAGLRIELGVEVVHARDRVVPLANVVRGSLAFQFGGGVVVDDRAGDVAAVPFERFDGRLGGGVEELGFAGGELGFGGLVEFRRGVRHGVEVPGRHRAGGQRGLERRQLLTGLLATGRCGCVTTGPAASIAQHASGRLGTTLGGQLA